MPVMVKGLKALQEGKFARRHIYVCLEKAPRKTDGIGILLFMLFLRPCGIGSLDSNSFRLHPLLEINRDLGQYGISL